MVRRTVSLFLLGFTLGLFVACTPASDTPTLTLQFDSQGGTSVEPITILNDEALTLPTPIKEGHTFIGWFTEDTLRLEDADPWQFDRLLNDDLTLFARWAVNAYLITFDSAGGSFLETQPFTFNETLPIFVPQKEGHTFIGWQNPLPETMPARDLDVTALWERNSYRLNFWVPTTELGPLGSVTLEPFETIEEILLGGSHSALLTSHGRLFMWGWNSNGQLGDGTTTNRLSPVEITERFPLREGERIAQVSLGGAHSAALTTEGRVFVWGWNGHGQIGDNTTLQRPLPTDITAQFLLSSSERITNVVMGGQFSTALSSSGRVFTWGDNRSGQLGDQTFTSKERPTDITPQFNLGSNDVIVMLAMGSAHAGALSQQGRVFMWGSGDQGRLGDGVDVDRNLNAPINITSQFSLSPSERVVTLTLGGSHTGAVTSLGRVFMWGWNGHGQLGDGTLTSRTRPQDITPQLGLSSEETLQSLKLGGQHSVALTSEGRLMIWGDRTQGKLGQTSLSDQTTPIVLPFGDRLNNLETVRTISVGLDHTAFVSSSGRVFLWGANRRGQIGNGLTVDQIVPYPVRDWHYLLLEQKDVLFDEVFLLPESSLIRQPIEGWYVDRAWVTPFDSRMPASDIHLYARLKD